MIIPTSFPALVIFAKKTKIKNLININIKFILEQAKHLSIPL